MELVVVVAEGQLDRIWNHQRSRPAGTPGRGELDYVASDCVWERLFGLSLLLVMPGRDYLDWVSFWLCLGEGGHLD